MKTTSIAENINSEFHAYKENFNLEFHVYRELTVNYKWRPWWRVMLSDRHNATIEVSLITPSIFSI